MGKLKKLGVFFLTNDRLVLEGKELDFYFPQLDLAVEWNGIYHFREVHGNLEKIQKSDLLKQELCRTKGIRLIVVEDRTSSKKFIEVETNKLVKLIASLV